MVSSCQKHGFTIVEVLVAIILMSVVGGVLVLGVQRSLRATHLKTSKERIERMLLQAFRFASVSGHVGDVVIRREEDGTFEGYINLWEVEATSLCLLAQKCESIGHLSGIHTMCLNDKFVHKAIFRFFGGHGLSTVYAYDTSDREVDPASFGFSQEKTSHKNKELEITIQSTQDRNPSEKISLDTYLLSIPHHLSFPDEYLINGT